jgi:predicted anti-sigma-YlaC factor YlaD
MNDTIPPTCALGLTGERLSVWRDGLVSASEMARISAHVPTCQACQAYLAQFDAITHQLRGQRELEPGMRIWRPVQKQIVQIPSERRIPMKSRSILSGIGAVAAALLLIGLFVVVLQNRATGAGTTSPPASSAFKVTSVDLAVQPTTLNGVACGTTLTVTYTATFHIAAGSPGGTIQFMYTANNGRSSANASVVVGAGKTTATYAYATSGTLSEDHTFPGIGEVITTSPNSVTSPQAYPKGACSASAFTVTSIGLAVSPASIAGMACGTRLTVTYTATFHIAPQSSGGTIQFMYTSDNGRGSANASVTVAPANTTATYSYSVSGTLAADHTFPGIGEVIATSPNSAMSPQVVPQGACS